MSGGRTIPLHLPDDLERAFTVMKELRPKLDLDEFTRIVMLAQAADGYRLVAREENNKIVAVMGYRILHDLAHGSHLFIDDLVTAKDHRGSRHGAELLRHAESETRRLGLTGLCLTTGNDNERARKFYAREGWDQRSVVFKKKVESH